MPNLFRVGSYCIFFWSNENGEPIHVHISEGRPQQNATKIWLTQKGECIIANNNSHIPENRLNEMLAIISAQFFFICRKWKTQFSLDEIRFYC